MMSIADLSRWLKSRALDLVKPHRTVTIRAFHPGGCRFEIRNAVDAFRVERFGGEEEFTRMILDELRPGDTIFDIGACVGLISIHSWKRGATVVAFEPDPGYGERLVTNLALNQATVQVVRWAVSDSDGKATLFTDGAGGASPSLMEKGGRGQVTVPTRSIDAAIAAREIPSPQVVKMDIEGAEILALRGMRELLGSATAPRAIFLELHPEMLPSFGSSADEVQALLKAAGYRSQRASPRSAELHFVYRKSPGTG